jgi:hypothetical protein
MQSRITGTTMPVLEFVLDSIEAIMSEAAASSLATLARFSPAFHSRSQRCPGSRI